MEDVGYESGFVEQAGLNASCRIVLDQFMRQEPVHAYLLSGARGLGKATFAKALACALFCTGSMKPCGNCVACQQVLHGANPDVLQLEPEGDKRIGVEKVREVIDMISQHAFGADFRVILIKPVEMLTPQAQNCLLKSLEEPVSDVIFLLMAHEMTAILGTIASRCARVKMTPWPDEVMRTVLHKRGFQDEIVEGILPLCSGNIGLALTMLAEQEQDRELRAWVVEALSVSCDAEAVRLSTRLKDDREGADRYLTSLEQALHQALLVRIGRLPAAALEMYPVRWKGAAAKAPVGSILNLLHGVAQARRYRASQVNWQSTIDHLLMKILGETLKWRQ